MNEKVEKIELDMNKYWCRILVEILRKTFQSLIGKFLIFLLFFSLIGVLLKFSKIFNKLLSVLLICGLLYFFIFPLLIAIEEISHALVITKKRNKLNGFYLEIRSVCISKIIIFFKKISINFEGKFRPLDYIHFLGGGPIGFILFLIILLPFCLLLFNSRFFLIYAILWILPINSLFLGKESDGRKAYKIAREIGLSNFEFLKEFLKGGLIIFHLWKGEKALQ